MRFSKWHALGNSYLVVERADAGLITPARAQRLCDCDRGIGSDGVLEVLAVDGSTADVTIWNPDGSTAEMSGNGTRIAAAWLARKLGVVDVVVRVGDLEVAAHLRTDGLIETQLGATHVQPVESLEVDGEPTDVIPVTVGNPHAVVRVEAPTRELLLRLGPLVETHARFPGRTNVQLARPTGDHTVEALVWERGAGETSASGSSAVAVAAAAVAYGWCTTPVTVHMPGGDLHVQLAEGLATLVGPAEHVCSGDSGL